MPQRTAALHRGPGADAFIGELSGSGEDVFEVRWHVPHDDAVVREATEAEKVRLEMLHDAGLSFGYDAARCVAVRDRDGKEIALFAFGATLPWKLSLIESDTSPGYAELQPARILLVELTGAVPARLFTAALMVADPPPGTYLDASGRREGRSFKPRS